MLAGSFHSRLSRPRSIATFAILSRRAGCRAVTTFACPGWVGRRVGPSGSATACPSMGRSWRRSTNSRSRSLSPRWARAHDRAGIGIGWIAVLALLAALLPPGRGGGRLHHVARGGRRRRQSAVVSALACESEAGPVGGGDLRSRTAHRALAQHDG